MTNFELLWRQLQSRISAGKNVYSKTDLMRIIGSLEFAENKREQARWEQKNLDSKNKFKKAL